MHHSNLRDTLIRRSLLLWRRLVIMSSPITAPDVDTSQIWRQDDWDICCILDACRPDVLGSVLKDDVETTLSGASMSKQWYELTFCSETTPDLSNIGLISGNPWVDILPRESFGYVHYETVEESLHHITTVPPEPLVHRAIDVWRDREKLGIEKLIVHFMQPHLPFRTRPEWFEGMDEGSYGAGVYWDLATGKIPRDEFMAAYEDNTRWVLEDGVEPIKTNCDGRLVLTADHSTGLGEMGIYSHPPGVPTKTLQEVPWVEIDATDRGMIDPAVEERSTTIDTDEQLRALGYKA